MASEPSPDYTRMTAPEMLNAVRDDAWKWADAFMQTLGTGVELDHALMVGWFANAIEHSHALRAAAAVRERESVSVPREPDEDAFSRGVYAVADALCASEYVNAPDASFVLSLAHRALNNPPTTRG